MRRMIPCIAGALLLAGCGQKGPLYMPDEATQIVTRPAQTPPATSPPAPGNAPNTPQTSDSPTGPDNPAPEVQAPDDKDKKEPGAQAPR